MNDEEFWVTNNIIRDNLNYLRTIVNPHPQIVQSALSNHGKEALKYIEMEKDDIIEIIINSSYPQYLEYVDEIPEYLQLKAVAKNPNNIRYINNPTLTVKRVAVVSEGMSIYSIENPSEQLKLLAIKSNPRCIQYLKNLDFLMMKIAIESDPILIKYIAEPYEDIKRSAVLMNPDCIKYIKNRNESLIKLAITRKPELILYINNITRELINYAISINYKSLYIEKKYYDEKWHLNSWRSTIINIKGYLNWNYDKSYWQIDNHIFKVEFVTSLNEWVLRINY